MRSERKPASGGDPGNQIWIDFASARYGYFVQSPLVQIQITPYNPFGGTA